MNSDDFIVRIIDPKTTRIRGSVHMDENGFASVYLNARMPKNIQLETLDHELKHIEEDDFHNEKTIEEVEQFVHIPEPQAEPEQPSAPVQQPAQPSVEDRMDAIYARGLSLYGLKRDDPLWDKLFMVWLYGKSPSRFDGIVPLWDVETRQRIGMMVHRIFQIKYKPVR